MKKLIFRTIRRKELRYMSEEEKKAIHSIKRKLECEQTRNNYKILVGLYKNVEIEILLSLIEKQQKEIEELKKPKFIIDVKTATITKIDNEFISKDKIKEKIEELDNGTYDAKIILQKLLEGENNE